VEILITEDKKTQRKADTVGEYLLGIYNRFFFGKKTLQGNTQI